MNISRPLYVRPIVCGGRPEGGAARLWAEASESSEEIVFTLVAIEDLCVGRQALMCGCRVSWGQLEGHVSSARLGVLAGCTVQSQPCPGDAATGPASSLPPTPQHGWPAASSAVGGKVGVV